MWHLLEAWSEAHPLRPNQSQMARFFEISGSLLSNWKYVDSLMQTDDITLVAEKTGLSFEEVARAAAEDAPLARQAAARRRELDGDLAEHGLAKAARPMRSTGRALRRRQDEDAEASQEIRVAPASHVIDPQGPSERPRRAADRRPTDEAAD